MLKKQKNNFIEYHLILEPTKYLATMVMNRLCKLQSLPQGLEEINWMVKVFHLHFSLLMWKVMEGRSCDLELLRSTLIGSEMVNTNSFQKTFWEISLWLNGIHTCDYLEKCGMMQYQCSVELGKFQVFNLENGVLPNSVYSVSKSLC